MMMTRGVVWCGVLCESESESDSESVAVRIHTQFIGDSASHQVNLPSQLVKDLNEAIKTDLKELNLNSPTSVGTASAHLLAPLPTATPLTPLCCVV
jgi:hypothetical protein